MGNNREEVIAWLEAGASADYRAGVLLLQDHGSNRSLVNTLLKKESTNNREKLRYELVKLSCDGRLQDVSEVLSHFSEAVQGATSAAQQLGIAPDQAPAFAEAVEQAVVVLSAEATAAVAELTQRMQQAYNQRCQLSNSLADLAEADGPRVVAEILKLQEEYNDLSGQRQRLMAGQALEAAPAAEAAAPVADRAALIVKRGNLRSQVSKAKKAADAKPEDQLKAEKLAKLQAELEEVELLIKQLPA
ncbi:MAG: hypothetical protein JWP58_3283 [Hymenobacter sp.]|nr:hypothetical protein [Hymenobacter sp.]